jgi:hypothetical protein
MSALARQRVDLITVVWHESPAELERFGKAVAQTWDALPLDRRGQSIVVENADDAETGAFAVRVLSEALGLSPQRVELERNGGPAHAYNSGFAVVENGYACLFDPDGAPEPETLSLLLDALDTHDRAALAAATVLPFDESVAAAEPPLEVEWASAGATVYRAESVRALGGFDELFAYSCEEMDFGHRARKAGWTCLRVPAAIFRHEVAHKTSWRRALHYLEYLMAWRHIHFSRTVTAKAWLMQFPYLVSLGRSSGWRVAGGGLLGLFAYLRLVPACERRR